MTLCVVREFQTVHIGEDCRQNTAVLLKIPAEIVIAEPTVQSGQRVVVAEILQRLLAGKLRCIVVVNIPDVHHYHRIVVGVLNARKQLHVHPAVLPVVAAAVSQTLTAPVVAETSAYPVGADEFQKFVHVLLENVAH